ncbi:Ent2p [Sugiyamaella lignohabitans]|uniref:Ent2p n=1 Tax=Sugiyamaella lignohabitans TaxID=796027 RepID=A0A161HFX2_9ASCO|nr:Ent2p [Sugiyamaella lignohabitans]ANB11541.1 Ent2p [Sugiyamaella lignohabitans]
MSKSIVRSIKNVTNGYTSAQVKVRNATSNDAWGPSTSDMQEISRLTYENHELFEVMDMLDRRLNDKGKNWRHVMKALTVLDYIIHTGSENVVLWCKDNLYIIKTLREFHYIDESGRDQGASIRSKAKELTSLLQDDDRLREERSNRGSSRRRRKQGNGSRQRDSPSPPRNGGRRNTNVEDSDDIQRALEESRRTAEDDERRRKAFAGSDEDLRRAILLSEEEERLRNSQQSNVLFGNNSQPNLIDTSEPVPMQQQQQYYYQQQQQQPYQQQAVYGQATDIFGNPIYQQQQQPVSTGYLQNAYATTGGAFPQYTEYAQQQQPQQQLYQNATGYQQPQAVAEPEKLKPLKTGSNNPFAKPDLFANSNGQSSSAQPNLQQLQQQQQFQQQQQYQQQQQQAQQAQPQAIRPQRTNNNFDQNHMNDLNTLLSNGDGIDTFGNVGDLRIPAQHTKSNFVNSAGQGLQQQPTSNNPFLSQQYTGIATTNSVQPAFTGYGFGNANQGYGQQQQQQRTGYNNLIDL